MLLLPLPIRPADHRHQLLDFASLVGLVSRSYRVLDAVTDMVLEDLLFQTPRWSPSSRRRRRVPTLNSSI